MTATTPESLLLREALAAAAQGRLVIPLHNVVNDKCSCGDVKCKSQGKHPRTANGSKDGTTDPKVIRSWWKTWPNANIGFCTGADAGCFMVGPDGPAGIEALAKMEAQHGSLPRTPTVRSGSDGQHRYFRWPQGVEIHNHRNHRKVPIDVRGESGLAVAPPSRNAKGAYVWEIRPDECEIAEAPAWLVEWCMDESASTPPPPKTSISKMKIRGASIEDRAIAYLAKMSPAISGSGGHDQTFEAARVVVYGFDLGVEAGFVLLRDHYNPRCQPPWCEKDLRHKCQDADVKPFTKPRGWLLIESTNGHHHGNGRAPSPPSPVEPLGAQDEGESDKVHWTDRGNAMRLVRLHGLNLRHCQPWHKWFAWDGARWRIDDTFAVTRCAKSVAVNLYRWAIQLIEQLSQEAEEDSGE
jgi:hypothetical protein